MCRLKANLANLADVHHNLSSVPLFALRPVMFHLLERVSNQTVEEVADKMKVISERMDVLDGLTTPVEQMAQKLKESFHSTGDEGTFWKKYDVTQKYSLCEA